MSFRGHVQNGVVVFDEPVSLPEGTAVHIELSAGPSMVRPGTGDWDVLEQAAADLKDYDFDAVREQREYGLRHAKDHLL